MTILAGLLSSGPGNSSFNDVEPGLLGFLVVAFMGVALFFLLRSMNKHLRKLPPAEEPELDEAGADDANANTEDAKRG